MSTETLLIEGTGHGEPASASPTGSGSPAPPILTKTCNGCGRVLPATRKFFYPRFRTGGRLSHRCRSCQLADAAARWKNMTPSQRQHRYAVTRRYVHTPKGREVERKSLRDWINRKRASNPDWLRARNAAASLRDRSRRGLVSVDAFFRDFRNLYPMFKGAITCPCCGRKLDHHQSGRGGVWTDSTPTIDRTHPGLGYKVGNVQVICWRCNEVKRDATLQELEMLVRWLRTVW